MIVWEYAQILASMRRDYDKKDQWTVKIFIGLQEDPVFHKVLEGTQFKRLPLISAMGVQGWDLCGIEGEKVTYPGGTLGLGQDNTQSGPSLVRYLFKRPMQRAPTPQEFEFSTSVLGRPA